MRPVPQGLRGVITEQTGHHRRPIGGLQGRLLASVLFGVQPLDPLTFASAAGLLVLTAAAATAAPAWRAARIDPAVALRSE